MDNYFEKDSEGLIKVLVVNSVRCIECNTVLVSRSRHDFVSCKCRNNTSCDGGNVYQRYMGRDLDKIENLCEYVIMTEQEYEDMLERKRIKEAEVLQQKIDAGLMVQLGGKYIHKSTYDIIMKQCLKLVDK